MRPPIRCTTCLDELSESAFSCPRCGMPGPGASLETEQPPVLTGMIFLCLVGLALTLLGLAALPWLHSIRAGLVASALVTGGSAGALRIVATWWYRIPITYKGPIHHSERPVAYHLVSLSGLLFCALLTFAGLYKFSTGWTS